MFRGQLKVKLVTNRGLSDGVEAEGMLSEVLLDSANDCDKLCILSGYASSAMVKRHIDMLSELEKKTGKHIKIELIIGMVPSDGISIIEHKAFKTLMDSRDDFVCSYIMYGRAPCHSKMYLWFKENMPFKAFVGSANYTQNAFFGNQYEALCSCDPVSVAEYYDKFSGDTAYCNHDEIEDMAFITSEVEFIKKVKRLEKEPKGAIEQTVVLSLLTSKGHMGKTSSLNWGQRDKRNSDEAYIPIPVKVGRSGFFPPKKTVFTVMTDDGYILQCVMAQNDENNPVPKAMETHNDNSEMGRYFRKRIGLASGAFVEKEDLEKYGRTDVVFVKLDDGTYYMDFEKKQKKYIRIEQEH